MEAKWGFGSARELAYLMRSFHRSFALEHFAMKVKPECR
jgi:hypothetical protein